MTRILAGFLLFACVLATAYVTPVRSEPDTVVLFIDIDDGDSETHHVELTLKDLQALPVTQFATTTIWTNGPQVFSGVWLSTLLEHLEITSGVIELQAINDYRVSFPIEQIEPKGALLAYQRNGNVMTARENGPLWLVYDYDSDPEYRSETYYSRSIWQLDRISISR
ncbi:hypothetical protein SAMN05444398_10124 [Roseovarius pacificus]|uniref:Oxidoreductase molybdopterin-binding domain-containing protein n=1 Tax=Roseovarius pacificus TaxID=337701 RepID=A0A1M6WIH6_9RHOB|nr:hypothetical protein [Roseovarius pacificus]GGO53286.1 hypothetical protein GCM10011315_10850 [Roseovarius pacificus]SHK93517.1 hypothetical protein SAMN05444398_10124 [Roseovarius pacificus]